MVGSDGIHNIAPRQQEDESSHNHPSMRQTLFQALGITEWAHQQPADNWVTTFNDRDRIPLMQANSGLLQEVVNQGITMPTINQSRRPFSSVGQPISITPQSGSLAHGCQRLQNMQHSFRQRTRVHPTNFIHSPSSYFSPFTTPSPSEERPSLEVDPPNSSQAPLVEPTIHGFHLSTTLWPTKKRRAPALARSKSVGGRIDLLHPNYINTD